MLRVRPIHFTSRMADYRKLLTGLGLSVSVDNDGYTEFDAGSGRMAIHLAESGAADDGTTALGFEIRDLDEFIRRTNEAGTTAKVYEAGHGTAAKITAADGLVFLCDPVPANTFPEAGQGAAPGASPDALHNPGTGPDTLHNPETAPDALHNPETAPDPALSVLPLWMTPDVDGARKVLDNIGAKPRIIADAGTWVDHRAKNGGLVAAHQDAEVEVLMAFEYDGALETLQSRLADVSIEATIIDENYGKSLRLPDPDGGEIWVNQKQSDLHGYTRAE
ncbi:glyoxalase/bleomycin resistance/dioxygenase family protein [Arthrobacter castelli]|uniref:glyoxalase/bleomycin resistance/dioxygenase family protein n=1 Tax=Arthrobacter castelli TaxID=271431 RepID=UPI0004082930|nr:glyoxalase/bleomycin resistance/dioxygenase family protein [Arthrobacter castelli]